MDQPYRKLAIKSGLYIVLAVGVAVGIAVLVNIFLRDDAAVTRGRLLYATNCASCHGEDLEGQPDWQSPGSDGRFPAPPHDATGHTWHHSDDDLIAYITLGGEEALAQMGVSFDSGMPGFSEVLSGNEVQDILTYLKSRWPEKERAFQATRNLSGDQ